MEKFPELKNNQVALLRANSLTGHVLDEILNLAVKDEQKVYTVFNSYHEALEAAKSITINDEDMECVVYGKDHEVLFYINPRRLENSFNFDFLVQLQYHLERKFANSPDEEINQLWCDGIAKPTYSSQLTFKNIIDSRQITTKAWIGVDGQTPYDMIINLGEISVDRLMQGLSLIDCLPSQTSMDWILIDTEEKTIEVSLK